MRHQCVKARLPRPRKRVAWMHLGDLVSPRSRKTLLGQMENAGEPRTHVSVAAPERSGYRMTGHNTLVAHELLPLAARTSKPGRHVAFFLPSLGGGGAQRMVVNLASAFDEAGCHVDLVVARKQGPYLRDVRGGVRVISLDAASLRHALWPLIGYLRRERPEAIMATLTSTSMLAVVACKLSRVGSRIVLRQASAIGPRQRPWLVRRVYPYADAFVAQSRCMADDLATVVGVPPYKITTIRNPAFRPEIIEHAAEPVEHPWFTDKAPPVIIGVGRLVSGKAFNVLVDAFGKVHAKNPCRLVILGEGEARHTLQMQAERLGLKDDVWMPGFVDNPFKYVARSRVFVLSSRLEPFPNVLVEALAVGTPVVSTRCLGAASEILEHGRWGALVPVGDSDAMAEAIRQNIERPAHNRAELSRHAQTFDYRAVATEYMAVLGVDSR